MNLLMIIINEEFQEEMLTLLAENNYAATMVASTGEFLQYGDTTFILGVDKERTDQLVDLINEKTQMSVCCRDQSAGAESVKWRKNIATILIMRSERFVCTQ